MMKTWSLNVFLQPRKICIVLTTLKFPQKTAKKTYGDIMYMLDGRGYFAISEQEPNTEACSFYMSETITNTEVRLKPLLSVIGSVKSLWITGGFACLLLPKTKRLIIYALLEF